MLSAAVRSYANRFGVAVGRKVAFFTNNDSSWDAASDLAAAGIEVTAIIDSRPSVAPRFMAAAGRAGARVFLDATVVHTRGRRSLHSLEIRTPSGLERLSVDALAISGGWDPAIGLTCHLSGTPSWRADIAAFVPQDAPKGMTAAGAANGVFTLHGALTEGAAVGHDAARAAGFAASLTRVPSTEDVAFSITPLWHVAEAKRKAFVDFQNDVSVTDLRLAYHEGFRSVEHLKRYTTLGMATDQGKTANVNGLAIMASLTGKSIPETGTTRFRPPHTPIAIGAFAGAQRGKHFRPTRLTPSDAWAREQRAVFVEVGPWLRAQYFPRHDERDWQESVNREVTAVRNAVGICDVSTLGKIDMQGPHAAVLLDQVYANTVSTLAVGRVRYGIMLREDGIVLDDGTVSRLGDTHYLVTTTTANAARVMQHLEFCHQVLWPELDVQIVSVTDQWAQYAIAGPRSRDLLRAIVDSNHEISNQAIPYMHAAEVTICDGIKARLFRISFSGELSYELAVPARLGDALIRRLMEAGSPFGVTAYGTEALGVMRIEKGHAAGNEINGQTTAGDLGLGRMLSSKKDFIGRIMAARPGLLDPNRPTLVGFVPGNRADRLHAGAHFTPLGTPGRAEYDEGYMTSVAYSPTVRHWIGLGLLRRGRERIGTRVRSHNPVRGADLEVEVCSPIFIDPSGERLHA
jgi:sarcosine oxidase subunit alpha